MRKLWTAIAAALMSQAAFAQPPDWAQDVTARIPGRFAGLLAWQWVATLGLTLIGLVLYWVAHWIAERLMSLREKAGAPTGPAGSRSIRRGAGLLGLVLPWFLFLDQLELNVTANTHVLAIVQALAIAGSVSLVFGAWDAICHALANRAGTAVNAQRLLIPVTRKLVRFIILIAGGILALGVFGVNITGLLAGVGIGGLVVALAAKDSVENIFGSLTILFDMPFALGHWVKIGEVEGIVEEINLRSTRIRTFEDSVITLPNSNLIKAAVENYGARRYRRQRFQIRLSYGSRPENIQKFIEAVRGHFGEVPKAVQSRTVVELNDLNETSAGVLVQCFIEAESFAEEARLRSDLLMAIFRAQQESGVAFVGQPVAESGVGEPPSGSRELGAGSGKPQSGSGELGAGGGKPQSGGGELGAGSGKPQSGSGEQGAGSGKPKSGSGEQGAGSGKA